MNRSSHGLNILLLASALTAPATPALCQMARKSSRGAPEAASQQLSGAGSVYAATLIRAAAKQFEQIQPGAGVHYLATGVGAGMNNYLLASSDFAVTDRPLSTKALADTPPTTRLVPFAAGAVVVVVNLPGVSRPIRLSGPVLADIYLGAIRNWNDPRIHALNPEIKFADLAISVAHQSDGSTAGLLFTQYLSGVSPEWRRRIGAGSLVEWPVGAGVSG